MPAAEGDGVIEAGHAARLVEDRADAAVGLHHLAAGPVGGTEIDAQAELCRGRGGGLELGHRLAPFAVEERRNRERRGDAVADQLGEGEALLKGQLFGAVHLVRAALDVAAGPDPAGSRRRAAVDAEDGGVEVAQGVEVDEAGRDDRLAEIHALGHLAREVVADEDDAVPLDDQLAPLQDLVAAVRVADQPAGGEQRRAGCAHGASSTHSPRSAVTRPPFMTSGRGARLATASARVSPSSRTRSALQPGSMP